MGKINVIIKGTEYGSPLPESDLKICFLGDRPHTIIPVEEILDPFRDQPHACQGHQGKGSGHTSHSWAGRPWSAGTGLRAQFSSPGNEENNQVFIYIKTPF